MAYDEIDLTRIEAEFLTLSGGNTWERIEDGLWLRRQVEHAAWAKHGQWYRQTTHGKRRMQAYSRERSKRLQNVVVSVCACKACGKLFERTAYQKERGQGRVCSVECRGRARQNIELITLHGESLPLVRWAERYGLSLHTVWRRRRLGWPLLKALQTPVRAQGEKKARAA
jgi:hypothetical protein